MNSALKHTGLSVLRSAGVFSLASRIRRRDSLMILCYHGISLRDEHEWAPGLYIRPDQFRQRLEWLRDLRANVLPLGEALSRLHNRSLPPRSVVLTFDDGFYDFYLHAAPALAEFGFPCTLYLTTWYGQFHLPVFNLVISYLLWKSRAPSWRERASGIEAETRARHLSAGEEDSVARDLARSLGIDYEEVLRERMFQIMSPGEAAGIARAGIDIQLHTHRHRTPADRQLFQREIRDNAKCIQEITGNSPVHFCYPSGVTSQSFLPWLRECGVESATTCVRGLAGRNSDPLLLPRYLDGAGTQKIDFESWLCGVIR